MNESFMAFFLNDLRPAQSIPTCCLTSETRQQQSEKPQRHQIHANDWVRGMGGRLVRTSLTETGPGPL